MQNSSEGQEATQIDSVDWGSFRSFVNDLAKLVQTDFEPTLLVAVARGGWIPTRFLSNALGVKKIASIGIAYEDADRSIPVVYSLPSPLQGERILLIEDFLESGRSIRDGRQVIEQHASDVRTASLWVSQQSIHTPDFTLGVMEKAPDFPWEYQA